MPLANPSHIREFLRLHRRVDADKRYLGMGRKFSLFEVGTLQLRLLQY